MGKATGIAVEVPGLAKLRRDLKAIDKDIDRELVSDIRATVKGIRDEAQDLAPEDEGDLKRSLKYSVRSVYSTLPYAGVQEWGGVIRPRGVPIRIQGRHFTYAAIDGKTDQIVEDLAHAVDGIAHRHGFKG